ncbi:MAG: hypothetical protein SLAVMIC_00654 [uncultured marine phage]|uniref:Uncharacterized protein n=1 Tax=uncultured marine phage TaxID=707152 RepID=A0A8D9C9A7_9VIRU|nr:MAG: hypothetical protein SLAVMIC_00654 [uncultured marine phage]
MGLFTSDEANASNIVRAESIESDGSHSYWVFGIEDEDAIYYDWKDATLSGTASNADQKVAIHDFLTSNCEKKVPTPVITVNANDEIIGETVGSTSQG